MTVIAGVLADYPLSEGAREHKGSVIIEWPLGGAGHVLPSCLSAVYDEKTGDLIPAAKIAVCAGGGSVITADISVFLDRQGEIIHDPSVIWRDSDGIPATFTFLVAEMRSVRDHSR
jgi:hypothetical protein